MKNKKKQYGIRTGAALILGSLLSACAVPGESGTAQIDPTPGAAPNSSQTSFARRTAANPPRSVGPYVKTSQGPESWTRLRSTLAQPDPEHPGAAEGGSADFLETKYMLSGSARFTSPTRNLSAHEITSDLRDLRFTEDTADYSDNDSGTAPGNDKRQYVDDQESQTVAVQTIRDGSSTSLWRRIRQGFALPDYENHRVAIERRWYARHRDYMARVTQRGKPYLYFIVEQIEQHHFPMEIALLPIVESAFQPFAYSNGRAAGIWQFIPSTADHFGLTQDWWYDGRRDIVASTNAAIAYLERLHKEFDGDWLLALAAYNSGEGTVWKAIRRNQRRHLATDFWSLRLPKETRAYVPKLLAVSSIVAHPEKYHVKLEPIADEPYMAVTNPGSQIDLALVAKLAGISLEEVYLLNPGFNRWATHPTKTGGLVLPIDSVDHFYEKLAHVPDSQRISWRRHRIRNGETLSNIAVKYRTTVPLIRKVNRLDSNMIRSGRNLLIPVATKNADAYTLSAAQRRHAIQSGKHGNGLKITYIVRSGDSLWTISRKYRVHISDLARWNGMAKTDVLRLGQQLVIWPKFNTVKMSENHYVTATGFSSGPAVTQKIQYTVRRGDSLSRISKRFNIDVDDVCSWNTLDKSKYLQPGQRLTLFVDVTRQAENI